MDTKKLIPVAVRDANNTYNAKVIGQAQKCTCTSGALQAVEALARKFYGPDASVRKAEPWERLMPTYLELVPEEKRSQRSLDTFQKTLTHFIEV